MPTESSPQKERATTRKDGGPNADGRTYSTYS